MEQITNYFTFKFHPVYCVSTGPRGVRAKCEVGNIRSAAASPPKRSANPRQINNTRAPASTPAPAHEKKYH